MSVDVFDPGIGVADPEGVSAEDVATAYNASKTKPVGSPDGSKLVNVISPNGETFSLPADQLSIAAARGFTIETPEQKSVRDYVKEHGGLGGGLDVAMESFANEGTLGVAGPMFDEMRDPLDRAQAEALKKAHGTANFLGGALGFGASLLYGGEFFKGAEAAGRAVEASTLGERAVGEAVGEAVARHAPEGLEAAARAAGPGLARKMLASGAKIGVESAIIAAPHAVTEAALGNPDEAAETMLYAVGGGALLGMAGPLVGKVRSAIAGGAKKSLDLVDAKLGGEGSLGEKIAGKLRDFSDKEAIKAFNPLKKYSKKIDGIGESEVAAVAKKYDLLPKFGDSAEAIAEKVAAKRQEVGAQIGALVEDVSGKAPMVDGGELANAVIDVQRKFETGARSVGAGSIRAKLKTLGDDIIDAYPKGASLEDIVAIRREIDAAIPEGEKSEALRGAILDLRRTLENQFYTHAERSITEAGGDAAATLGKYRALKSDYRALVPLSEATADNIARGLSNRSNSLTDYLGNMIGGGIGSMVGGPVGAGAGGIAGGYLNRMGRHYGNTYLSMGADKLATAFERMGGGGLLGVEQAMKGAADRLDAVPSILDAIAVGKVPKASVTTLPAHLIADFAGSVGRLAQLDKFNRVASTLTGLASDPARMQATLAQMVAPIQTDAPNVAAALAVKATNAIKYLASTVPKNPNPPNPFVKTEWKPSDAELHDFARRVQVVNDPFAVLDRLGDKTLSKADVDSLKAVYPAMYDRIKQRIIAHVTESGGKDLPFAYRVKLSQLFGAPIDPSMRPEAIASYQQSFAQSGPPEGHGGGPPPASHHGHGAPKNTHAKFTPPNIATDIQRVSLGGGK